MLNAFSMFYTHTKTPCILCLKAFWPKCIPRGEQMIVFGSENAAIKCGLC